jgi:hypothetical protein
MHKLILFGALASIALMTAPTASAQTLTSGVWKYRTSGHWVKGRCPAPVPGQGKVRIVRKGSRFTVQVLSGMKCSPASMCFFKGSRQGKVWVASNRARVDNEGGRAENVIKLVGRAGRRLTGTVSSAYKHPSGFTCRWGFKVVATR